MGCSPTCPASRDHDCGDRRVAFLEASDHRVALMHGLRCQPQVAGHRDQVLPAGNPAGALPGDADPQNGVVRVIVFVTVGGDVCVSALSWALRTIRIATRIASTPNTA